MTDTTAGTFQTIVCSIPGVGKWVWTKETSLLEWYPNSHVRKNKPTPDVYYTHALPESHNTASWALRTACLKMINPEFDKYSPDKRLKRFKDS